MSAFGEGNWLPRRDGVRWAGLRGVGPYRLGPKIRTTRHGAVWLAVHPEHDRVLELEHYRALEGRVAADPEGLLMLDVGQVLGLRQRHLSPLLGAGVLDGAPYVVRPHHLGRLLADVLVDGPVSGDTAVGIVYGVAEALAFLAQEGPQPGVCAHGGVELDDVFLGFDGTVLVLGAGLRRARGGEEMSAARDHHGVIALARALGTDRAADILSRDGDLQAVTHDLRRAERDACGLRGRAIATLLRTRYADEIAMERAALGLPTLH